MTADSFQLHCAIKMLRKAMKTRAFSPGGKSLAKSTLLFLERDYEKQLEKEREERERKAKV